MHAAARNLKRRAVMFMFMFLGRAVLWSDKLGGKVQWNEGVTHARSTTDLISPHDGRTSKLKLVHFPADILVLPWNNSIVFSVTNSNILARFGGADQHRVRTPTQHEYRSIQERVIRGGHHAKNRRSIGASLFGYWTHRCCALEILIGRSARERHVA